MTTITIQPDATAGKDTRLVQSAPDSNFGTGTTIYVQGYTTQRNRPLIEFDLSVIPFGATITSAILTLTNSGEYDPPGFTIELFRVTQAWTEAEATWNKYDGVTNWASAGGDFHATVWASQAFSAEADFVQDIGPLVQAWLDGTYTNLGFLLKLADETAASSWGFRSSDYATAGSRPKLVVTYTPAPQPGGFSLRAFSQAFVRTVRAAVDAGLGLLQKVTGTPYAVGWYITGGAITIDPGAQITGYLYRRMDVRQGTISVWVTPDWAGDDGQRHVIAQWSTNGLIYKHTDNRLYASFASGVAISVDVSAWVASAVHRLDIRWDSVTKIDGTNHICISVDDSHTFGRTTAWTPEAPGAAIHIGRGTSDEDWFAGQINGLTIARTVYYDGTNGIDTYYGLDTVAVNAAKTSGSTSTTLARGVWDVLLLVSTNSVASNTPTTGTQNAWSMPVTANALGGTNGKNGYMGDGTYTNDGLAANGTPTVAALADASKIFGGGYLVTHDAASEWVEWTLTGLAVGACYVVRAIAHSDGTSVPRLRIYDATNGAEIAHLDGSTAATRATPSVLMFSFKLPTNALGAAADCASIKVQLQNTHSASAVAWHQVELFANILDDPSFQYGGGDPYIPTGWSAYGALAAGETIQDAAGRTGKCLRMEAGSTNHHGVSFNRTAAATLYAYRGWGGWMKHPNADGGRSFYHREDSAGWWRAFDRVGQQVNIELGGQADWRHHGSDMIRSNSTTTDLVDAIFNGATGVIDSWADDFYIFDLDSVTVTVEAPS